MRRQDEETRRAEKKRRREEKTREEDRKLERKEDIGEVQDTENQDVSSSILSITSLKLKLETRVLHFF